MQQKLNIVGGHYWVGLPNLLFTAHLITVHFLLFLAPLLLQIIPGGGPLALVTSGGL